MRAELPAGQRAAAETRVGFQREMLLIHGGEGRVAPLHVTVKFIFGVNHRTKRIEQEGYAPCPMCR